MSKQKMNKQKQKQMKIVNWFVNLGQDVYSIILWQFRNTYKHIKTDIIHNA